MNFFHRTWYDQRKICFPVLRDRAKVTFCCRNGITAGRFIPWVVGQRDRESRNNSVKSLNGFCQVKHCRVRFGPLRVSVFKFARTRNTHLHAVAQGLPKLTRKASQRSIIPLCRLFNRQSPRTLLTWLSIKTKTVILFLKNSTFKIVEEIKKFIRIFTNIDSNSSSIYISSFSHPQRYDRVTLDDTQFVQCIEETQCS